MGLSALNPIIRAGKQIAEGIILHEKTSKREAENKALTLLKAFMMNSKNFSSYPFELSGGMKQRILAAIGISCNPIWLIADEPTKGCKFHPRCEHAMGKCSLEKPLLYKNIMGSEVRCFLFDKIGKCNEVI